MGWLRKSNFVSDDDHAAHLILAREFTSEFLCRALMNSSQWFAGEGNRVADLLSCDLVSSDHKTRTIINSRFPSQVPKSFKVSPLPANISSFLSYWVQLRTLPKGVTGQTHRKDDTSWRRWIEFLVKANFLEANGQGAPYLGALDRSETHCTLGAFVHSVRMCHYSKSTKEHAELVASTCRTAVDGVATAFIAADAPDPQLDSTLTEKLRSFYFDSSRDTRTTTPANRVSSAFPSSS